MEKWKWCKGRQNNVTYEKFCLWSFKIWKWGFDAYILKYAGKTILPWHKDPVENGEHHRINITLKGFSAFYIRIDGVIEGAMWEDYGWFRPDLHEHMVDVFTDEGCTKLSIGFVKFK